MKRKPISFEDLSNDVLRDDVFARLLTFPNVLVTGHQGFFTQEALKNIADTTIGNIEFCRYRQSPARRLHGAACRCSFVAENGENRR